MITWKFTGLEQMADFFDKKASEIRAKVPKASRESSKNTMRSEAHAYEQCAMIARSAEFTDAEGK